jgi:hypothetical protein
MLEICLCVKHLAPSPWASAGYYLQICASECREGIWPGSWVAESMPSICQPSFRTAPEGMQAARRRIGVSVLFLKWHTLTKKATDGKILTR